MKTKLELIKQTRIDGEVWYHVRHEGIIIKSFFENEEKEARKYLKTCYKHETKGFPKEVILKTYEI